jgi:hypothetical protein
VLVETRSPAAAGGVIPAADSTDEAFTLAFLNAHEVPCPGCGYNVHSLPAARCPECGLGLRVGVVATDKISAAWLLLMITVAAGAGVGLLVAAVVWREGWPRMRDYRSIIFNLVLPYFLGMIPLPLAALAMRRWLGRRTPGFQWLLAAMCLAVTAGVLALFLWNMAR